MLHHPRCFQIAARVFEIFLEISCVSGSGAAKEFIYAVIASDKGSGDNCEVLMVFIYVVLLMESWLFIFDGISVLLSIAPTDGNSTL